MSDTHDRMQWWRAARFGMFVHWGLYAIPAGRWQGQEGYGEWIMREAGIAVDEYEKLASRFNPDSFDPHEWVGLARAAGMRYLVFTTKHHDGFALWDSKVSDYNVVKATPYGLDVTAQIKAACDEGGLRFCVYHSIWDWHQKDAVRGRYGRYLRRHLLPQLEELLELDPGLLWFDGEWVGQWKSSHARKLYQRLRALKPDLIINNRIDKGRDGFRGFNRPGNWVGDYLTPEQQIPDNVDPALDWETNMTMNDHWGFVATDANWKSAHEVIWRLVDIISKGGNFLLNVGPRADGSIPAGSIDILRKISGWMEHNAPVIFESSVSQLRSGSPDVRILRAPAGRWFVVLKHSQVEFKDLEPSGEVRLLGRDETWSGELPASDLPICLEMQAEPARLTPLPVISMDQARDQNATHNLFVESTNITIEGQGDIFYTTDGSRPDRNSALYSGPFRIEESVKVRALAVQEGWIDSYVAEEQFWRSPSALSDPDCILGEWIDAKSAAVITIRRDDGHYNGTITWTVDGDPRFQDFRLMDGFLYKRGIYSGGQIIDPEEGRRYSCRLWLANKDILNIRGYVGLPMLGRTEQWRRVEPRLQSARLAAAG